MDEKNAYESAEKLAQMIQQSAFSLAVVDLELVKFREGPCYDDGNGIRLVVKGLKTARALQAYILSSFGNVDGVRCAEQLNCLSVTRSPFRPEGVRRPQDFADCYQLLIVGTAISTHFEEVSKERDFEPDQEIERDFLSAFDGDDTRELDDLRELFQRMSKALAEILETSKEELQVSSYVNRVDGSGASPFIVVHGFRGVYRAQKLMDAVIEKIGNANYISLLDFSMISPEDYGWTGKFGVFFGEQIPQHRHRPAND